MRILGVDPGIATVGFAVLDAEKRSQRLLTCGVITTPAKTQLSSRLDQIYRDLNELIAQFHPEVMAVEELFFNTNITKLAYAEQITISSELPADAEKMVSAVTEEAKLFMPMAELIDLDKERARLEKELEKARKNYEGQMRKLSNENFISRAPEAVVQTERERAEKAKALVENLEASLKNLG